METTKTFTHVDKQNNPCMVDVTDKIMTPRFARARSIITLPSVVFDCLVEGDIKSKKGPVFQTAIIAGTSAVKQTSSLIPFCHPLIIDGIKFKVEVNQENRQVFIDCTVKVEGKTGVEMEALTGASVAALTVYDMCKAFSQNIIIEKTCLMDKTGGKTDFHREESLS